MMPGKVNYTINGKNYYKLFSNRQGGMVMKLLGDLLGIAGILIAIAVVVIRITTGAYITVGVITVALQSVLIGANTVILAGILLKLSAK
jgi:hypothetical protein